MDEGGGCCVSGGLAAEDSHECCGEDFEVYVYIGSVCRDAEHHEDLLDGLFGLGGLVGVGCAEHAEVDRGGDGTNETNEVRRRRHEKLRTSKDS